MASSSGINFSGLASGLDTNSIITQLVNLERTSATRLQRRQVQLQNQRGAYGQLRSQMQALNTAINAFNFSGAFNPTSSTSSSTSSATITSTAGAPNGIYKLKVSQLASAHKITSRPMQSTTDDLGMVGDLKLNGKTITLEATDSLNDVAAAINAADADVLATVVNGGAGKAYLTLTSKETGVENAVDLSANTGLNSIAARLGLTKGFETVDGTDVKSKGATDSSSPLTTSMGIPAGRYDFSVDGKAFSIDPTAMSLDDLAAELNGGGVPASVETFTDAGVTKSRLVLAGAANSTFDDPNGFLSRMGVLRDPTVLVQARDARFEVDGIALTSSTNELRDVIQGATVNLLKASADEEITLSVSNDPEAVVKTVKGLVTAYNNAVSFVNTNSKFDSETFQTGILFGDSVASQFTGSITGSLFSQVANLPGQFRNLTQVGFQLSSTGELTLDESALKTALATDPEAVADLFRSRGTSENGNLTFVSSGNKTNASGPGGYAVNVTALATKGRLTGAVAPTSGNRGGELLSFSGASFGAAGYQLAISSGETLSDVVTKINQDSKLKDLVEASIEGGKLKLESKRWGSGGNFSVTSNLSAAADTTGIGVAGEATKVEGTDIQGTINGAAATGSGQFLLGTTGDTEGLQIQYTGTATGAVGSMKFTTGVSGLLVKDLNSFLDAQAGLIQTSDQALNNQIRELEEQVKRVNDRAIAKEQQLRTRFAAMESSIQAAQSQLQRMQAMMRQL